MSGRTLHLREGKLITNRKTDRRQAPKRPLPARLDSLNETMARRFPTEWKVRMGFQLPKLWRPFVSDGPHGIGVLVHKGFVQVNGGSAAECFQSAIEFCAVVGRRRAPEVFMAVLRSTVHQECYTRWLSVVNGALVECSCRGAQPRVYEARAA